jgi:chromosome segregation ATPase
LLTAGWQIAEFQERIELLEMDKEVLVLERDELCKALAERSAQMEDLSKQLQSLRGLDQRHITEAEARESLEARASALREEVRGHL